MKNKKLWFSVISILVIVVVVVVSIVGVNYSKSVRQKKKIQENKKVVSQYNAAIKSANKRLSPKLMPFLQGEYLSDESIYDITISGNNLVESHKKMIMTVTGVEQPIVSTSYKFVNLSLSRYFFLELSGFSEVDIERDYKTYTSSDIAKVKKATRIIKNLNIKELLGLGTKYSSIPHQPYVTNFDQKDDIASKILSIFTSKGVVGITSTQSGNRIFGGWLEKTK